MAKDDAKKEEGSVTVSLKTGTIITILGGILGAGGGLGGMQFLNQPNAQVVQRLNAIEAEQARQATVLAEQERLTQETNDMAQRIHRLILRAHKFETTIDGVPVDLENP